MPAASPGDADPVFQQTLISASRNARADCVDVASGAITPDCPIPWSIRKISLHGGRQEGVDLIVLDNGNLRLRIIPTRGMGILDAVAGDVRLGWHSPVEEVVHPSYVNLQDRGGIGWLEGFNELLVRCGLESNGPPGADQWTAPDGSARSAQLTLHGRVANIPAHEVEILVDRRPPYALRVRGIVDERHLFGPALRLTTVISTTPGAPFFRVEDVVENLGGQEQEFEMLYHCNFGPPLLGAGATFLAPVDRVIPMTEHAAKSIDAYADYAAPVAGFSEQVYCMHARPDSDGRAHAMLRNSAGDRAALLSYSPKALPCLTLWKNTAAEADGYVTGIEPGTNFPQFRSAERKAGRVPRLRPGASHTMSLDFTILAGAEAVREASARLAGVQSTAAPIVDRQPLRGQ